MIPPVAARLPDGRRLHLQHGPVDLVVEVTGPRRAVEAAETAAVARFETILPELVAQLPSLRSACDDARPDRFGDGVVPDSPVARRMVAAAARFPGVFRTPMVCVAGSVADEVLAVVAGTPGVTRAYVNNGGDVALHLDGDATLTVGLVPSLESGRADGSLTVHATDGIGGLATSGAGGRSFSLGVADAVTVVASCAAVADVAASLVANEVDLPGHAAVERAPADQLDPDSDLGDRPVTVAVGTLTGVEVDAALDRGVAAAEQLLADEPDLRGIVLALRGARRVVGPAVSHLGDRGPAAVTHPAELTHPATVPTAPAVQEPVRA